MLDGTDRKIAVHDQVRQGRLYFPAFITYFETTFGFDFETQPLPRPLSAETDRRQGRRHRLADGRYPSITTISICGRPRPPNDRDADRTSSASRVAEEGPGVRDSRYTGYGTDDRPRRGGAADLRLSHSVRSAQPDIFVRIGVAAGGIQGYFSGLGRFSASALSSGPDTLRCI